jgi:hypothetical protein
MAAWSIAWTPSGSRGSMRTASLAHAGCPTDAGYAHATVDMWNVDALIAKPCPLEELLTTVARMV